MWLFVQVRVVVEVLFILTAVVVNVRAAVGDAVRIELVLERSGAAVVVLVAAVAAASCVVCESAGVVVIVAVLEEFSQ